MRLIAAGALTFLLMAAPAHATETWGDASHNLRPYTDFAQTFWEKRGAYAICPGDTTEVEWWDYGWGERATAVPGIGMPCDISINPDLWHDRPRAIRCTTVLHEWGHLTGLTHEPEPWHIMYENPRIHPACRWHFPRTPRRG